MLKVYTCLTTDHDVGLVALAIVICALASFAAVKLLDHVGHSHGTMRRVWLLVAAVTTGFGVWATHFIAMLAFQPAVPSAYHIALTTASLVAAIGVTGAGLAFATSQRWPQAAAVGGAIVGGGIAAMHYIGMAAFEIQGRIEWDFPLVVASILLAGLFGALALQFAVRANTTAWKTLGAFTLTVAICSHHFTAMGAAAIVPDPRVNISEMVLEEEFLAFALALVSVAIVFAAFAALALDLRDRRRAAESVQLRALANAAVEGLVVCERGTIVTANTSFQQLAAVMASDVVGRHLETFFPDVLSATNRGTGPIEAVLATPAGEKIPVEIIQRDIEYLGSPHQVLAIRDIRARKQAEENIYFLAQHDPLTRLPNRTTFHSTLSGELSVIQDADALLAVLFIDLDRFKEINDLFGHTTGDAVLKFVGRSISGALPPGSLVARFGGDEFAVIVTNLKSSREAELTAEAIIKGIGAHDENIPPGISLGASIGIAMFPKDASDATTLLSHADAALYEAKAGGRGTYRRYTRSLGSKLIERRQIERDLRTAIVAGELHIVYQPQANVRDGQIFGLEALLRWKSATRGSIAPSVFVPIAEECGAISEIGGWVLEAACREAVTWHNTLSVAVNVSAAQLHTGNFPSLVERVLKQTGLKPNRLELEITESALIRDRGRALKLLRRLKKLGIRLAIDDFGTGYSSLSNLRAFPFDRIKIDRSFVHSVNSNAEAAAIIRAVIALARSFSLEVLAEGVETIGELDFLRAEGCDALQGYIVAAPAPIADFARITTEVSATGVSTVHKDILPFRRRGVA
jgi:diguanylate cyclase (GGDEF)-like protein/PAS domain S-box-containing protein